MTDHPQARLQHILEELAKHGRVTVKALAAEFSVSPETVRRDLKQLEMEGHLRCIYGGGVTPRRDADQPISQRMRVNAREKAKIATLAARELRDHTKIFLDSGTTMLALSRYLVDRPLINIYTNSLDIIQTLSGVESNNVVAVGGVLRPSYRAFLGTDTLNVIREHLFDIAFVSAVTVDVNLGFMDLGEDEALVRRALRRHAKQVVMLADSSKFGRQGNFCTYNFRDVDLLITDAPPRADFLEKLEEAQVKVMYA
ncbi:MULTISPECIES: DeoR/GlpR family DNA-binding transcription regulator [Rhizobium]|uniref:DeoR/GlpR family DNA-binding transcription regulator n=1 Tax=Rhizobium TaxID=379 RepID=UPI0014416971|nr:MULTISPECIES: DeoR/GlpR family DNA-binding transcription regulator [Rhizobium]MBY3134465.1 DeoR/GlpR transcriptional regulator [Rhizobium laguerreae]MBY3445999.1 DeoR/GlpR transcriptional regulator [Rhizobium laguerreae]MBY5558425.1 DeoR/GlpR transcriptional regulator [Rhizobium leguminosarum]NKN12652.1 DeoR family transcriptional regulator [Rhizobium laguerreae]QSW26912.1 DeoR/GlpR transcriptional regulator [Rhizobium leguminosarum]